MDKLDFENKILESLKSLLGYDDRLVIQEAKIHIGTNMLPEIEVKSVIAPHGAKCKVVDNWRERIE